MLPNVPTIGVRFDTARMNAASHAADAWKAFWRAVDPAAIAGALLFDGDVAGGVFCIAVQSMGAGVLEAVEGAVAASEECRNLCAVPMFVKGEDVASEPLKSAGNVDAGGGLVGEPGVAHSALLAARPEKATVIPAPPAAAKPSAPPGAKPASQLARGFARRSTTIGSHAARAALTGDMFGGPAAAPKAKSGAAAKKSSLGKTVLAVVVAIVVLALIALMIWDPKPGEAPLEGVKRPGPETQVEKAAPVGDEALPSPAAEKADAPDEGASE